MSKWNLAAPGGKWSGQKLHHYATVGTIAKHRGKTTARTKTGWEGTAPNPQENPTSTFEIAHWAHPAR